MNASTLFLLLALMSLSSCLGTKSALKFVEKPITTPVRPDPEDSTTEVNYEEIKSQILTPHCLGCHKKIDSEAALIQKWVTPGRPETSKFFTMVESGLMPKNSSPLDSKKLSLIREYILGLDAAMRASSSVAGSMKTGPWRVHSMWQSSVGGCRRVDSP
jgi:hypothetical protein